MELLLLRTSKFHISSDYSDWSNVPQSEITDFHATFYPILKQMYLLSDTQMYSNFLNRPKFSKSIPQFITSCSIRQTSNIDHSSFLLKNMQHVNQCCFCEKTYLKLSTQNFVNRARNIDCHARLLFRQQKVNRTEMQMLGRRMLRHTRPGITYEAGEWQIAFLVSLRKAIDRPDPETTAP